MLGPLFEFATHNMKASTLLLAGAVVLSLSLRAAPAEVKVLSEHISNEQASAAFKFKQVPPPSASDSATKAQFSIVDGAKDDNGGDLDKLHDGKVPTEADQPSENFFFDAGTAGGRLLVDLGTSIPIQAVNTYSWHPSDRGPQVYSLYASDGKADAFNPQPKKGTAPDTCGWGLVAKVDTRPKSGEAGGQYGVSIADPDGILGTYRYLLFDVSRTEDNDEFGNTFYSEIDVIGQGGATATVVQDSQDQAFTTNSADGYCTITIDTARAPDLKDWAEQKLAPVLADWYPKLTAMLASPGYEAPTHFSVTLRPGRGVAATGGTHITANSGWLARELNGEAVGALLHEEVHVVQQYHGGRRGNPDAPHVRPPGWLVEGIPDYIRWFKYEPQSHGADIDWLRSRHNVTLRYDGSYRITANFLDYVITHYDPKQQLITELNAACREGRYNVELWKTATGKTLTELSDEWKTTTEKALQEAAPPVQLASAAPVGLGAAPNTLTEAEKAAGWILLFNGNDFTGWHNFRREGVRPGWEVKDGELVCADPHNAGDIVTTGKYSWFVLELDYNISEGGNSGIMYHVTDQGRSIWATGPEFQLEDNAKAEDPIRCGWLYALYKPPIDPKTGKTLDATKPAGEWNHVRLVISPKKCEHYINGVKYLEYVLGSEDFNNRVKESKFGRMPYFAKSDIGYIGLQGDHGRVAFRNVKLRPLPAD
jgi:3-keto-disaccharide hydrolase/Peptidase of plants and bacteria